ncbi:ABC transporter substrate-binding protein [Bradyrhizobium sp. AUGA SZCCT0177]|uniref:ABC transporter substrate-binding protein n=1 Tax=Bradyrhizobium sp. AUGA SZCCT0177 TaxID=2807665 RepID=UPI001BACDC38|nr:ABC transporter substrate-binding protein [Bradyrhizobium sp. AUGA SZCCT0177]MBR1287711.1 ABC transporter substrate-binding protein [Bradyrhizobium sp. AUGA SZCCT0177]
MRRRDVIIHLGGAAAAWSLAARAQERPRIPKIGIIIPRSALAAIDNVTAFEDGLRQHGYIEGQSIAIVWHYADGNYDLLAAVVDEMLSAGATLLVVGGTTPAAIVNRATSVTPIVFVGVTDPIGAGVAQSLARPGGNATGLATAHEEAYARKSVELLKEALPWASHIALLYNVANPFNVNFLREAERVAPSLRVRIDPFEARTAQELDNAISAISGKRPHAVIVATDPFLAGRVKEIVTATTQHRLPAMFGFREYPLAGGLMSYGANLPDMYRRAAMHVDRILKGAKPADLPIELPTKFETVINLKTAKALGIEMPPSLLVRADEVIE